MDDDRDDDLPADAEVGEDAPADATSSSDGEDNLAQAVTAAAAEPTRSKIGLVMFASAGALWGLFGMMRCDAKDASETPSAAVTETPPTGDASAEPATERPFTSPEPSDSPDEPPNEDSAPEPMAERPELDDATPNGDEEREPEPVGGFDPKPAPASWARDFQLPKTVKYTVRRGGTLENVANLYKIFHHEITALNPGVDLKQNLPPKTPVVVYRADEAAKSHSIGLPSNGELEGGVPMVDGPGRVMKMIGWKSFGTAHTVAILDTVLRRWDETGHAQPILVGNMSSRGGGKLSPHSTHQSGRDVDLGYMQILPKGEELNWRVMDARNLDAKETWALMSLLVQTGEVEVIYVDREIQKLMHAYATEHRIMSKNTLRRWMEYPSPTGSGSPVMRHVKGHADHMHVRFKCQPHETRCKSRSR